MSEINYLSNIYKFEKSPITLVRKKSWLFVKKFKISSFIPSAIRSESFLIKIANHLTYTGGLRFITHKGGAGFFREESSNIIPTSLICRIDVYTNTVIEKVIYMRDITYKKNKQIVMDSLSKDSEKQ